MRLHVIWTDAFVEGRAPHEPKNTGTSGCCGLRAGGVRNLSTIEHTLTSKCVPTPVIGAVTSIRIRLSEKCVFYSTAINDTLPQSSTKDVASDTLARVVSDYSSCILSLEAG